MKDWNLIFSSAFSKASLLPKVTITFLIWPGDFSGLPSWNLYHLHSVAYLQLALPCQPNPTFPSVGCLGFPQDLKWSDVNTTVLHSEAVASIYHLVLENDLYRYNHIHGNCPINTIRTALWYNKAHHIHHAILEILASFPKWIFDSNTLILPLFLDSLVSVKETQLLLNPMPPLLETKCSIERWEICERW